LKQILNELQQIRQLQHHPVQQQLPNINIPPPQLPPGAVAIPLSQQHGPPLAQIQSDIAKHQQGIQYAQAMINLFNQRLANNTSTAHATQVLKQMTAEGKINCPTPFTNPGHCFLTPKPVGIAPPIPPFANLPPIPPPFLASIVVPAVIAIIQFTIRGGK
jgi:hypothetical protein